MVALVRQAKSTSHKAWYSKVHQVERYIAQIVDLQMDDFSLRIQVCPKKGIAPTFLF